MICNLQLIELDLGYDLYNLHGHIHSSIHLDNLYFDGIYGRSKALSQFVKQF